MKHQPLNILFIGDIVARPGREAITFLLPEIRKEHSIDFVIANVENLAGGKGVTHKTLYEMSNAGIDLFTSGNHVFFHEEWKEILPDKSLSILRPANYPEEVPGRGMLEHTVNGQKVILINIEGRAAMESSAKNPFFVIDTLLEKVDTKAIIIVDMHADLTSEKRAMGFYLDGRVSACIGTHTHVPTADLQILPQGTFYATDVGMTGNIDSVLGVKKDIIIDRFKYPYPRRFIWEYEGEKSLNSILFTVGEDGFVHEFSRIDKLIP